jgi:ribosomal protein S18 acetylase RimI-like enzyme
MTGSPSLRITQTPEPIAPNGAHGATTIRRAKTDDAQTVLTLVRELAAHEDSLEHVHTSTDQWEKYLQMPEVIVLLAEKNGQPIGYVSSIKRTHLWTGGDILALDDLYVRPGHRNSGAGELLMRTLASLVAEERLLITWGVDQKNEAGQRFYRRLGATLRTKVVASWTPESYNTR